MSGECCTHGADCTVHPDINGLHDLPPSLAAVMALVDEFGWACVDMGSTRGSASVPQEQRAKIVAVLEQAGLR